MQKLSYILLVTLLATSALFGQNYNFVLRSSLEFPGQKLANVHGYVANGHEYALVGGELGLIIIDVTEPENPLVVTQIPGPSCLWREVKTYKEVAVVTTECGPVQIIDLTNLPSTDLQVNTYTGDGNIAGLLGAIHALHIDEVKGFCYLFGGSASGAWVLDMNTDPMNPTFAGEYQTLGYIHDGFAENDTLYAAHIYDGVFSVVDMTDKQNPDVLGSAETPTYFPHNTWLTSDHKTLLTTDEKDFSYLTSFDVSDPTNIKELDRFQCTPGSGSVPHNTHILDDFAVTSWYTDGVNIVDAHKPDNLVQVAWYDTYPEEQGGGYNGCWGVYPFFPSGNFVATNIPMAWVTPGIGKFFVLTPTLVRAAYLEGKVTNAANGQALPDVLITLDSPDPLVHTTTDLVGEFKTGQPAPGVFLVTFEKDGFLPKTVEANLVNGEVTVLDVALVSETTGVGEEHENAQLSVHPVVFTQETRIDFSLPAQVAEAELKMSDLTGKLIWRQTVFQAENSIIFNEKLVGGAYILGLYVKDKQVTFQKIIKR